MPRYKDHLGREFVVESEWRDISVKFDTDNPCAAQMICVYADWLDDHGCPMEAELIRLQWQIKIGTLAPGSEHLKRINELKEYFGIKDTFRVSRQRKTIEPDRTGRMRERERLIQMFLEEPLGYYYTKATVNLLHIQEFLDVLHDHPILNFCIVCNGTRSPALVSKYLNYPWLRKCMTIELNNLDIDLIQLRQLFSNTEIKPSTLIISGPQRREPTRAQLEVLPTICPGLKYLWSIQYGRIKHDYRVEESS